MVHFSFLESGQIIAGVFSSLSVALSLFLIYKHLRNYTSPHLQRYIIRILLMVPIYAIDSWLSLKFPKLSSLFDLMRDCYEAYCIYCFFALMVTYVQTSMETTHVGRLLESKPKLSHPFPLCFLPRITLGRAFLRQCYQCILQFVILKPAISLTSVILIYYGPAHSYDEVTIFKVNNGYLWLTIVENISITISLYYLVLYYMAVKEELTPFKPVGKFICIKAVIFFSFWQGVAIGILASFGIIQGFSGYNQGDVGRVLQDFVICIEMFILSILHHYVFPYRAFHDPEKVPFLWDRSSRRFFRNPSGSMKPVVNNFIKVVSIKDVLEDTRNAYLTPLGKSCDVIITHSSATSIHNVDQTPIMVIEEYEPNSFISHREMGNEVEVVEVVEEDSDFPVGKLEQL